MLLIPGVARPAGVLPLFHTRPPASESIDPGRPAGSGQPRPSCPQRIRHPLPPRPHAPTQVVPARLTADLRSSGHSQLTILRTLWDKSTRSRASILSMIRSAGIHTRAPSPTPLWIVVATEGSRRRNSDRRVTTARRLLAYGPLPLPKAVSSPVAESCGPKERKNRGYATGLQDRTLVFGRALEDEVILLFDPAKVLFHVPDNLLDRRVG